VVSERGTLRLTLHVKVYPRNRLGEQVEVSRVREPVAFTESLPEDLSNFVNDLRGGLLAQHIQCGGDAWQEGGDIAQFGQVTGLEGIVGDGLFGFGQIRAGLTQGDADQDFGVAGPSSRSGRNPPQGVLDNQQVSGKAHQKGIVCPSLTPGYTADLVGQRVEAADHVWHIADGQGIGKLA